MSLLEDIFLQDEADEAQELERIIEGDEYDERPRDPPDSDENSEKEDEAEEDKRRVDPSSTKAKRVVKNPRFILNPARLTGPRGIQVVPDHFKGFKFKGKGHEKEDLDMVLKKLEHWAYRLYPKFHFEDCLKKIETLGKKRPVMVHLQKIRSDQLVTEDAIVQRDSSDDELPQPPQEEDEFDKLLAQQIELARNTPAPGSVKKPEFTTPAVDNRSPLLMPKATSSPSISDEQKERMMRNRKLAEERRLSRLKATTVNETVDLTNTNIRSGIAGNESILPKHNEITDLTLNSVRREFTNGETNSIINHSDNIDEDEESIGILEEKRSKKNKSNVIDSSDEEYIESTETATVSVDVHKTKEIIDISEGYFSRAKIPESDEVIDLADAETNYTAKNNEKQISSNVIDSSDNEDNTLRGIKMVSEEIHKNNDIIDISEDYPRLKNFSENNQIVDLADIEIKEKEMRQTGRNISNIADSSEDECDLVTIDESVTVDIHNNVTEVDNEQTEINDSVKESDSKQDPSETRKQTTSVINIIEENSAIAKNNEDATSTGDKGETKDDEISEDLMDVDFSDDF